MASFIIATIIVGILIVEFFIPSADSMKTISGKETPHSWYFGEGLKPGDFFEYKICDSLLIIPVSPDHCYAITLDVVTLLPSPQGNMWIISAHVAHHVRNVDFILQVSNSSFKIVTDGSSIPYADSLERTLEWVMNFASNHKPQPLVIGKFWGVVASDTIPETKLTVMQIDSVPLGQEIIPTYKIGYSLVKDSFLQIKDDFPIPIRAVIYKPVSAFKDVPLAITFDLLNYSNGDNICEPSRIFITSVPSSLIRQSMTEQKNSITNSTKLDHTKLDIRLENITENQNNRTSLKNNIAVESESDIETETFNDTDFREKLKNSTTAQVLKDLYGPDYEKIITSFDKFIALLTNTTNTIVKNQLNSTSP